MRYISSKGCWDVGMLEPPAFLFSLSVISCHNIGGNWEVGLRGTIFFHEPRHHFRGSWQPINDKDEVKNFLSCIGLRHSEVLL